MAGSVWERKDGRFGAEFRYKAGGLTKTLTTTRATREAADAWLAGKEADRAAGQLSTGSQTVRDYLEEWLKDAVEPSVSRRTHEKRAWAVRLHIAPALGRVRLPDLDACAILVLHASMAREGYSHETRREIHVTLKMALKQAVRWGLIARNPAEMVDAPRDLGRHDDEEVRHLTDAQARLLFAATAGSRWRNYYPVAVRTGLRPGEMLALRWGTWTSGDPGSLRVRRTLDTHSAAVFGPPKTPAARRTVALHFEAKEALLSQKAMLMGEDLPTGERALVFPSKTGSPMKSDNPRKRDLEPVLARAGLPEITLHELRHTFASVMLHEWMAAPAVVSQMLGHKYIAFTFDLYGHLIPSARSDVMRRLNPSRGGGKRADRSCRTGVVGATNGKSDPLQGGGRWFEPSISHFEIGLR